MKKKILIIVIAAVLTLALAAVLIFVFAGKGNVPPAGTDALSDTRGEESDSALESFTMLPDDVETEAQGPVVSPEPLDPEDPYVGMSVEEYLARAFEAHRRLVEGSF